jgi:hypothetical protein
VRVGRLASFQNPTAAPITVPITFASNLGADSTTAIIGTSSGTPPCWPPISGRRRLIGLHAAIPPNAVVDLPNGAQGIAGERELPITAGAQTAVFFVRRIGPSSVHVPLTITDTCGEWPSFVGGGEGAF